MEIINTVISCLFQSGANGSSGTSSSLNRTQVVVVLVIIIIVVVVVIVVVEVVIVSAEVVLGGLGNWSKVRNTWICKSTPPNVFLS
jgi:hypothetical protein